MSTIIEHRSCNCEDKPCCGCDNGAFEVEAEETHGWPGDGSGEDDFADMNANEADDYRDEGDDMAAWEDRFEGADEGPEDFGWGGDESVCGE